jgi:uncharacterized membrane protein
MSGLTPPTVAPRSASPEATRRMARLLRGGLTLSAAVIIVGLLRVVLTGESLELTSLLPVSNRSSFDPTGIWSGLLQGTGSSVLALGLLILVATPVARVALGAYTFQVERDPLLVRATLVVLALLLLGLFALGPLLR